MIEQLAAYVASSATIKDIEGFIKRKITDDERQEYHRLSLLYKVQTKRKRLEKKNAPKDYISAKERTLKRQKEQSESGRNIGELPQIVNLERRISCETDFRLFCLSYFPDTFSISFSSDHLKILDKIQSATLHGGLFALAMPRGSGKTTLTEVACIWAVVYGHHSFVALIGSDEKHAVDMLESIKVSFEVNDLLLEDFPETVYPIVCLDGIAQRAGGQLYKGEHTRIGWTAKEMILPTMPDSVSSGAIIKVAGITGGIRGMKHKRADGKTARPSIVIIDDPQTDESARSVAQCAEREAIISGAILGLAGPRKKISAIMPCTVIQKGDMADNILNREKHPDWQGERTKMVYSFPKNEKLWDQYAILRGDGMRAGDGGQAATDFYAHNRELMDEGAVVAWSERYNPDELSAIQHAMNLKLRDESAFYAEYQNEPIEKEMKDDRLTVDHILSKLNGREPAAIPQDATTLTMFVDVQGVVLYYVIMAFGDGFTGYVIDYGTYPDQQMVYYGLKDVRFTLQSRAPGAGQEGAWYAGFAALCKLKLNQEWKRDDGVIMKISRCLIDANDGNAAETVFRFARQCEWPTVVMPSRGRGIGASGRPMADYEKKPGDKTGLNWMVTTSKQKVRYMTMDVNFWKSFVRSRWLMSMGDKGCYSVFGKSVTFHRMFAEQATAEYSVRTEGRGRVVDEWKLSPGRDNHFFDCVVGCSVCASEQGIALEGAKEEVKKRKHISLKELQEKNRGRR